MFHIHTSKYFAQIYQLIGVSYANPAALVFW